VDIRERTRKVTQKETNKKTYIPFYEIKTKKCEIQKWFHVFKMVISIIKQDYSKGQMPNTWHYLIIMLFCDQFLINYAATNPLLNNLKVF